MKKKVLAIILFFVVLLVGLFYFRFQVYYSHSNFEGKKTFEIVKGDGNEKVAKKLKKEGLISGEIYFYYYIKLKNVSNKIMPGVYEFSSNMTIPEIIHLITNDEEKFIKITFPEGWDAKKMAERLTENGLDGKGFLEIVNNPGDFKKRYNYLTDEKVKTLEGYLFPDTYFFKKDVSAENIVGRLLDTFDKKLSDQMRQDILSQNKSINDIIVMASILEMEVRTLEDRELVSGIFWKRIELDMPLQSDITLTYATGIKKEKYSLEDTQFDSLYNTYKNKGLPPGPIDNPGLEAITASIYPKDSSFLYFLSDIKTGKTLYAETFDEHIANKNIAGL